MNARLISRISAGIKKTAEILEKKRPLQRELEELMMRPVSKWTTPEKCWDKEYNHITKRLHALEVEKNSLKPEMNAIKADIYAALYPSARQIAGQKTKDDIWILEKSLVFAPAELNRIRADYINPTNPVMLRLIERYAKEHFPKNAKDFAFETEVAEKYTGALDVLVQLADEAFADPYGSAAAALEGFINLKTGEPGVEKFIEWTNAEKDSEKE